MFNKTFKISTIGVLLSGMLFAAVPGASTVSAETKTSDNGNYEYEILDNGGIGINSYYGDHKNLVIPNKIDNKPVKEINYGAFSYSQLTSVKFPRSVENINGDAFVDSNLTSVSIPNGVKKIGSEAFGNNNLTSINIPESVEKIGTYAFGENNLTDIQIKGNPDLKKEAIYSANSNVFYDQKNGDYEYNYVFDGDKVVITDYTGKASGNMIPKKIGNLEVKEIKGESEAYSDLGLDSLTIPNYIENVGGDVFGNNHITDVTIKNRNLDLYTLNNQTKGDYEFSYHPKEGTVDLTDYMGNKTDLKLPNKIDDKPVKEISSEAFSDNNLTSVSIPNGVKEIERSAFKSNNLTSVEFPKSIEEISFKAFKDNNIEEVTIPENILYVKDDAFKDKFNGSPLETVNGYKANKSEAKELADSSDAKFVCLDCQDDGGNNNNDGGSEEGDKGSGNNNSGGSDGSNGGSDDSGNENDNSNGSGGNNGDEGSNEGNGDSGNNDKGTGNGDSDGSGNNESGNNTANNNDVNLDVAGQTILLNTEDKTIDFNTDITSSGVLDFDKQSLNYDVVDNRGVKDNFDIQYTVSDFTHENGKDTLKPTDNTVLNTPQIIKNVDPEKTPTFEDNINLDMTFDNSSDTFVKAGHYNSTITTEVVEAPNS